MGYEIYGHAEYRNSNGEWEPIPVYKKTDEGHMEIIKIWRCGSEIGHYLTERSYGVMPKERANFIAGMGYEDEDFENTNVYAISLAQLKYIGVAYKPDYVDDDLGERIKDIADQIEKLAEMGEIYRGLDEIRYIFYESY